MMVKDITIQDVRHMAQLSRLVISSSEEELFVGQFARILDYMQALEKMDTNHVEPMYRAETGLSCTRQDLPDNLRDRNEILANAPETDGESFIVPRIV